MTAFFETRSVSPYAEVELGLYGEDERIALDVTRYNRLDGRVVADTEIMLDREQVSGLIDALTTMRTMIQIRHPQPAIEAPKEKP